MQVRKGKIEEVFYARLDPGADLLKAIWQVCRENDIKTGLLLDATGSMRTLYVQRWPTDLKPDEVRMDFVNIDGPLEISAHGIIGVGLSETDDTGEHGYSPAGFESHDSPYVHVHCVASNAKETICGHLMEGSYIHGETKGTDLSHFTMVIAKVTGFEFQGIFDMVDGQVGFRHELADARA